MNLTEIINNIDDITDPSSMDNILMYVDFIQARDQEFIELLMEKLPDMEITWKQPWYQQNNSLTRPVKADKNVNEKFRTDKLSSEEIERIHKNWRKFRKLFGIPNNPECFARWKNTSKSRNPNTREEIARRFVTAYLARGLERSLYQVYKHVSTYYGCPIKGFYSLQEEKLMEVCFYHNAKNAIPILSKVLGRESRGIYKKLQEWFNGKPDCKRMTWKLPVAAKFLKLIIARTAVPLEELKYKKIDKSIWLELEEDMNHPYIYLQKFWYNKLHVQIFVKKDIKIKRLRKNIALKLQESSYRMWRDIKWKEMLKHFPDGFTETFLYTTWISMFRKHKNFLNTSLNELIEYGLARNSLIPNRRLRTLQLDSNGDLIEVRYKNGT